MVQAGELVFELGLRRGALPNVGGAGMLHALLAAQQLLERTGAGVLSEAIEPLMLLTNPWRLSLLFLVAGAASRLPLGSTK